MSESKIYFQWQNKVLEETIYPLRKMNLRNALEFYEEIDLWKQYKGQNISDLKDMVELYHTRRAQVIQVAAKRYDDLLVYFDTNPPKADPTYPLDEVMLVKLKTLHENFTKYYGGYTDTFKQSYFISQRLEILDRDRKELDQKVSSQMRRLNAMRANNPKHPLIPTEAKKLTALQNLQPMYEERRRKLVELIAAFGKQKSRRDEYAKKRKDADTKRIENEKQLAALMPALARQTQDQKNLQGELGRLQTPPDLAAAKNHFTSADAAADIRANFPEADQRLINAVNGFHKIVANALLMRGDRVKWVTIKPVISNLQTFRQKVERGTAGLDVRLKDMALAVVDLELERMSDLNSALAVIALTPAELSNEIQTRKKKLADIERTLPGLKKQADELENKLAEARDFLKIPVNDYVTTYQRVDPTPKEIVLQMVEDYRESLKNLDQYQLLAKLIERFKKEPTRYPRWLQYMIVHFAGMRYASAHGSWADPKDLYLSLRTARVSEDLRKLDDFSVEELCNRKLEEYIPNRRVKATTSDPRHQLPKLAFEWNKQWREKVDGHLARMQQDNIYSRRAGLLNLLLDEDSYEVEKMTAQQALEALERIKDTLPEWMWKEISAITDLRLKETRDQNWERLTPEEQEQRNAAEWSKYREIMNAWKLEHLVGWRKEHERNIQTVVSRAVCNEVAEHIQHLRGHVGGAGLASKPDWYGGEAKKAQGSIAPDKAYFIRPRKIEDYKVGASILWLQYRGDGSKPWNLASNITIGGDMLVPNEFLNPTKRSAWSYQNGGVTRKNTLTRATQSLYWLHEATVAAVGETAEGRVVLTFETSLPYEDRRLSCVGVFKHYEHNILYYGTEESYNGSFVGYVPENPARIPTKDLDEMLDWDKVLLKV